MKRVLNRLTLITIGLLTFSHLPAQDINALLAKVKARLATVNDYQAKGTMKIDVPFISAPESEVLVYFRKPDQFRVKKKDGISLLPKGGVSVNMSTLLRNDNYTAVPAGKASIKGFPTTIVKLLPLDEASDVVLTTLYIDERSAVIRKTSVTTRNNGTYEMELDYGKYLSWGLPDKVVFSFNTSDYKLPKGITFEYEKAGKKDVKPKSGKSRVEITYNSYIINKGVSDELFKDKS